MSLLAGWFFVFGLSLSGTLITKKISWSVKKNNNYLFFLLINGVTACGVFFVLNGFHIERSAKILICAVIYATLLLMNFPISHARIRLTDIVTATVLSSAGSIISDCLVGVLFFDEDITWREAIRIILMLGAVLLVFLNERKLSVKHRKKSTVIPLIVLTSSSVLVSCLTMLLQKYYANTSDVADQNSYFFFTNLVMVIVILPIVLWKMFRYRGGMGAFLKTFPIRHVPLYMGNTLLSNIRSVVNMFLLARIAVTVYTPISSALGILAGISASLILREQLTVYSLLAAGLSLIVVVV